MINIESMTNNNHTLAFINEYCREPFFNLLVLVTLYRNAVLHRFRLNGFKNIDLYLIL